MVIGDDSMFLWLIAVLGVILWGIGNREQLTRRPSLGLGTGDAAKNTRVKLAIAQIRSQGTGNS